MTTKELIAVLRHYAALYPHQVCPPGVLLAAAEALAEPPRRSQKKPRPSRQTQDVAFAPEMRHDME